MSQTLTQPEEIDSIWRAMAWLDSEAGAPIQEGGAASGGVYGFDDPVAASSYGMAHQRSAQSDPSGK